VQPEELIEAVTTRLARQAELKCEITSARKSCARTSFTLLSTELVGPLDAHPEHDFRDDTR